MTKSEALVLMQQYSKHVSEVFKESAWTSPVLLDLIDVPKRFPEDGSENKAMRWLGYMQGVLASHNVFTLDELKEHSRRKSIDE